MDSGSTNPSRIFEAEYSNIRELDDCTQTHPTSCRKFTIFLLIAPQPIVPWTNGGYIQNQPTGKVQGAPLMKFLTLVVMPQQVVKFCCGNFENQKIRNVLACRATTSDSMAKWRRTAGSSVFQRCGNTLLKSSDCRW